MWADVSTVTEVCIGPNVLFLTTRNGDTPASEAADESDGGEAPPPEVTPEAAEGGETPTG